MMESNQAQAYFLCPKFQVHSTAHNGIVSPRGAVTGVNLGFSLFSGVCYREQRKSSLSERRGTDRSSMLTSQLLHSPFRRNDSLKNKQLYLPVKVNVLYIHQEIDQIKKRQPCVQS